MREKTRDSRERPRPEQFQPLGDIKPSLFQERIEGAENILGRDARQKVERVILTCNLMGLSWPLMYSSMLAQFLPRNFPNAEFVDFTGLMKLVKMPGGQSLRTPTRSFNECGLTEGWGRSIHFYPGMMANDPQLHESDQANALTLFLPEFGQKANVLYLKQPCYDELQVRVGVSTDNRMQKIKDRQARLLRHLGLDALPEAGAHSILTADEYSADLTQTITQLSEKVNRTAGDKPVVLINTAKREDRTFWCQKQMHEELVNLVGDVDAAYVVNRGRETGGEAYRLNQQGDELFQKLKSAGGDRVLDLGQFDLTNLAALMIIADKSGGCMVDLLGGPTILADWLGTREAMVELHDWDHLTRKRDNLTVIKEDNVGELVPKVKGLLERIQ